MSEGEDRPPFDRELPFWEHVRELGVRLRRALLVFAIVFVALWLPMPSVHGHNIAQVAIGFFTMEYNPIIAFVFRHYVFNQVISSAKSITCSSNYIVGNSTQPIGIISTTVLGPFVFSVELSMVIALLVTIPVLVYEVYQYVKPALYPHELRAVRTYVWIAMVLFYLGAFIGYYFVFPAFLRISLFWSCLFGFVHLLTTSGFLDTLIATLFFAGFLFETPVAMALLTRVGFITPDALSRNRPYIYFGVLVAISIINPDPTLVSTLLWFIMFIALFEAGYVWSKVIYRNMPKV
ncbi:twin-arginine translocase subunit TatC [Vulcanisaeta souniana]|uniref:Sec-independent protein translocase protein TatC n=1 Tax=Vulcanisaeta souniana JCM 11219 TaxID=1293586 RepID=A0A830EBC4_9CREN|nr:twin-arginine translocase subunit TatC [Vulcanisaeta souniana]BDR93104.1 Sec-independent protein translocase TatC [Vulcanisaeta souniana JCM 11219]GGI87619.1 Sec-independent protein translocase TatC [Vulcanisaeta souniana JCM 11219]